MSESSFTGTEKSRYSPASAGPFRCDRCWWYDRGTCLNKEVQADDQVPHAKGAARVDAGGCCENWKRERS